MQSNHHLLKLKANLTSHYIPEYRNQDTMLLVCPHCLVAPSPRSYTYYENTAHAILCPVCEIGVKDFRGRTESRVQWNRCSADTFKAMLDELDCMIGSQFEFKENDLEINLGGIAVTRLSVNVDEIENNLDYIWINTSGKKDFYIRKNRPHYGLLSKDDYEPFVITSVFLASN